MGSNPTLSADQNDVPAFRRGIFVFGGVARFVKAVAENRGHVNPETLDDFYAAGYTEGSLIDVVIVIGDKIISNYLHALTDIPIDWALAPELETAHA